MLSAPCELGAWSALLQLCPHRASPESAKNVNMELVLKCIQLYFRLNLDEISIANLPKEARLVLTLTGRTLPKPDNQNGPATEKERDKAAEANQKESPEKQDDDDDNRAPVHIEQEELGWTAIQLFDYNGFV